MQWHQRSDPPSQAALHTMMSSMTVPCVFLNQGNQVSQPDSRGLLREMKGVVVRDGVEACETVDGHCALCMQTACRLGNSEERGCRFLTVEWIVEARLLGGQASGGLLAGSCV